MRRFVVGTRSSRLALAQTTIVTSLLSQRRPDLTMDVIPVKTLGDRLPPEEWGSSDGKAAFTSDLESMLIDGRVDIAVHSMKDLPSEMDERLVIAATPGRADPRDALLSTKGLKLHDLPHGAKIGTSSLRRRALLLRMRADVEVVEIHGNVDTRMRKLDEGGLDAVVLAVAGLERLGASQKIVQYFTVDEMMPAVGQGILAVQSRRADEEVRQLLSTIDERETRAEATCERAFSRAMGVDCQFPVGANAECAGETLSVTGMVASKDGKHMIKKALMGTAAEAASLGTSLAAELLSAGGDKILEGAVT